MSQTTEVSTNSDVQSKNQILSSLVLSKEDQQNLNTLHLQKVHTLLHKKLASSSAKVKKQKKTKQSGYNKGGQSYNNWQTPGFWGADIRFTKKIRYQLGNLGTPGGTYTSSITARDIIWSILTAQTTTQGEALATSARLRSISFFSPPSDLQASSANGFQNLSFEWSAADTLFSNPDYKVYDSGTGVVPPVMHVSPPEDSLAAMWFSAFYTGTYPKLCEFTMIDDTIMDITIDYVISIGNSVGSGMVLTGATTGSTYYAPIDYQSGNKKWRALEYGSVVV